MAGTRSSACACNIAITEILPFVNLYRSFLECGLSCARFFAITDYGWQYFETDERLKMTRPGVGATSSSNPKATNR